MAKLLAVLVFLAVGFSSASAQRVVDHWATAAECMAAKGSPFYRPSILRKQALGPDEAVRGHPTGGCFDIDLPDRMGGRGFVRIEAGRPFVYNLRTSEVLKLAECNNDVHSWVPFEPPRDGRDGRDGKDGRDGTNGLNGRDATTSRAPFVPVKDERGYCSRHTTTCWVVGGLVVTGGVLLATRNNDKPEPAHKGPGEVSDSTRVCTGVPCPGAPGVSPLRTGPGLMFDPANRSMGWRIALPRP